MKGFTDYPRSGESAVRKPLREVEVVSYDGDKYVTSKEGECFKRGYFYRNRRRSNFMRETLSRHLPETDWEKL